MTGVKAVRKDMTIFLGVLRAVYWFDDALQENLEAAGVGRLTRAQSLVIANVAGGEARAAKIARNLGVSRQAISQVLMELERQGYVAVKTDPHNRRARIIRLSTSFEKHGETCARIFRGLEKELAARIGKPLVESLREAFCTDWGPPPRLTGKDLQGRRKRKASS